MDAEPVLTPDDVARVFADAALAAQYPPILTLDQASALVALPKGTLYAWSSQGRLRRCCRKVGRHLRFERNKFYLQFMNGELDGS